VSPKYTVYLTAVLALACAAVLAVGLPVSARADGPVAGDTTATNTAPAVNAPKVTADGQDLIVQPPEPTALNLPTPSPVRILEATTKRRMRRLQKQILVYKKAVEHWNSIREARAPQRVLSREFAGWSLPALQKQMLRWKRSAKLARIRAQHPPHMAALLCIHHYEGSWTDTGAPFWGGLQMNYVFQATYAPWLLRHKGTADHWTPLEQIWTAEKAVVSRGFWPWPNTARDCGLL